MITILDTSALITLYQINGLKYLNSIFSEVYLPLKVEHEFLAKESDEHLHFLFNSFEENLWFKKCQTYSDDIIEILKSEPKIDAGEREAIAQYKQLQIDLEIEEGRINCILDESTARKVAQRMNIKVNGTLYLMAIMHFKGFIDYHIETERIKEKRRFKDEIIKEAFLKAEHNLNSGNIFNSN